MGIEVVVCVLKRNRPADPEVFCGDLQPVCAPRREAVARRHLLGQEEAEKLRAAADCEGDENSGGSRRQGRIMRGEGDMRREAVADAFGQDPDFYAFIRGALARRRLR